MVLKEFGSRGSEVMRFFKQEVGEVKKALLMLIVAIAGSAAALAQPAAATPADKSAAKTAAKNGQMSLADARGKIDQVIESPALMKEIMQRLSSGDQKQFLADVNKAIGDMPASVEEKAAKFLNVNHMALTAAQKGNTTTLLSEVFATVPPEALTVINERFAVDLLNRAANPNVTYTDEQYSVLAVETMKKINERTEETDNGSARSTFAILMFLRASNMSGESLDRLQDGLVDTLKHDDAKELARDEWIPAALGKDGREASYEPILASADAGRRPDFDQVLVIAGPQYLDSILADITGKNTDRMAFIRTRSPVLDAVENPLVHQIPTLHDEPLGDDPGMPPEDPANPGRSPRPKPPHPVPYQWQSAS